MAPPWAQMPCMMSLSIRAAAGSRPLSTDPMGCKEEMAYIPDNPDLYEYLTGIQYLNFIADVFSIPAGEREALIRQHADRRPASASCRGSRWRSGPPGRP